MFRQWHVLPLQQHALEVLLEFQQWEEEFVVNGDENDDVVKSLDMMMGLSTADDVALLLLPLNMWANVDGAMCTPWEGKMTPHHLASVRESKYTSI